MMIGVAEPVVISRAELARRAGVSKPGVTKACRGQLAAAVVDGGLLLHHPAVERYLLGTLLDTDRWCALAPPLP